MIRIPFSRSVPPRGQECLRRLGYVPNPLCENCEGVGYEEYLGEPQVQPCSFCRDAAIEQGRLCNAWTSDGRYFGASGRQPERAAPRPPALRIYPYDGAPPGLRTAWPGAFCGWIAYVPRHLVGVVSPSQLLPPLSDPDTPAIAGFRHVWEVREVPTGGLVVFSGYMPSDGGT